MAPSSTNSAWTIPAHASSLSHLTKEQRPIPTPGPHQVLIRLTAAALNYRDLLIATRNPGYPGEHKPGLVVASDAAGVVHSAHPSSKWASKVGTKVVLLPCNWESGDVQKLDPSKTFGAGSEDGVLQGWKVESDAKVVEVGSGLSDSEWASLATAGATAWSAIREGMDGRLGGGNDSWKGSFKDKRLEGKTILTLGTGGTSCFAIQVCVLAEFTPLLTFRKYTIDNADVCRLHLPSAPPSS
jgi:NADPH:quinone reductase-like Zn-dependent oxidoreductase